MSGGMARWSRKNRDRSRILKEQVFRPEQKVQRTEIFVEPNTPKNSVLAEAISSRHEKAYQPGWRAAARSFLEVALLKRGIVEFFYPEEIK
jgi:hypothetical protein